VGNPSAVQVLPCTVPVTSLSVSCLIAFFVYCNVPLSESIIMLPYFSTTQRSGLENANAFPSKNGLFKKGIQIKMTNSEEVKSWKKTKTETAQEIIFLKS